MRTFGKILIVWGVMLPLIALPSIDFGPNGVAPLLSNSLQNIETHIGSFEVTLDHVIAWALIMIGTGLSLIVTPP
jgi:hypothetical protein